LIQSVDAIIFFGEADSWILVILVLHSLSMFFLPVVASYATWRSQNLGSASRQEVSCVSTFCQLSAMARHDAAAHWPLPASHRGAAQRTLEASSTLRQSDRAGWKLFWKHRTCDSGGGAL